MSATTDYRACNLCEAICGLEIQLEGEQIVSIKGDKNDPLSRGHICPKAVALQDLQTDPDRLRTPLSRVGNDWQEISWDDAFELVASKLAEVRQQHGADAIASYQGNPNVHNYGLMTHGGQLLGLLKTRNRFSATSVDQLPHQLMVYWMYGHQLLVPIPDIDHTNYFLMLGANPLASNGSLMTVPDVAKRIKALQARGGKLVVIDPRRTETAALADLHLQLLPGSDVALFHGLLHLLLWEGLTDGRFIAAHTTGFEALRDRVREYTPRETARITGLREDDIVTAARWFGGSPKALSLYCQGLNQSSHGKIGRAHV